MFIGTYKLFLERIKYYGEQKQGFCTTIRIARPIQRYYMNPGTPILNVQGLDKLYNYILQRLHLPHPGPVWVDMPELMESKEEAYLGDYNRSVEASH